MILKKCNMDLHMTSSSYSKIKTPPPLPTSILQCGNNQKSTFCICEWRDD